ncbi:hypothetical protein [Tepidibacillus marianensis]|uniref:hypothetical protein n=1 Tax=Tepidibacillus marianensis TaxID=3131995 RepID=UPI0030D04CAA
MNEHTQKTVIQILTDTLAEMSTRAHNAEAEVERLKADDNNWYRHWQTKDAEVKKLTEELNELKSKFHDLMNERNDLKDAYDELKQKEARSHE